MAIDVPLATCMCRSDGLERLYSSAERTTETCVAVSMIMWTSGGVVYRWS